MYKFRMIWAILACLCAMLGNHCAHAEVNAPKQASIMPIQSIVELDLNNDGSVEHIEYEIEIGEDGYDTGYTLRINESSVTGAGCDMNRQLHLLRLDRYGEPVYLLMVSDYGPSDDPETTFFYWENGIIHSAGTIYAMPDRMNVLENGVITTRVRGHLLHTWFHEADFALGTGYDSEGNISYYMYQIPRYLYSMGSIVTLKVDLPLVTSMINNEVKTTLPAGSKVVLCATDDVEWVYLQAVDSYESGWMRVEGDYGYACIVGNESLPSYDVFEGLLFAD